MIPVSCNNVPSGLALVRQLDATGAGRVAFALDDLHFIVFHLPTAHAEREA